MKLSIISHYYNNAQRVERVVNLFRSLEAADRDAFEFVLVDDHSHEPVPDAIFSGLQNLRVFRIIDDVAWNMPAARNIGVLEARSEKLLLMDIDHFPNEDRIDNLLAEVEGLQRGHLARFRRRVIESDGSLREIRSHINSFVIHKSDFEAVGGYEELFSGHYGHEDKYFAACCRKNGITEVTFESELLVTRGTATKKLSRDKSINTEILKLLMAERVFRAKKRFAYRWKMIYPK